MPKKHTKLNEMIKDERQGIKEYSKILKDEKAHLKTLIKRKKRS